MEDVIIVKGEFSLVISDENGNIIEEFLDKNLVVNVGKDSLCHLLAGAGSGKQITKISFGTNGSGAALTDTVITGAFTKALGAVTYPEFNSVSFAWTLGLSENNGMAITEFGLMSNDLTLFARKVRSVINKTSSIQFDGVWKINFL